MRLSSKQAREFFEKERANFENPRWINHSICVCDTAGRIVNLELEIMFKEKTDISLFLNT